WSRKARLEYERYYKQYLKGFEKMELAATAALFGVRETRRIFGDYVLALEDFKRRAVFPDEIGRYASPVDMHSAKPHRSSYTRFLKELSTLCLGQGESYGIPYRILTPQRLKNVLVAGRCVSTDRYMQASIRMMPGCYITGQAAGVAAAMAARRRGDTRQIAIRELQARLIKLGAYLPHCPRSGHASIQGNSIRSKKIPKTSP
ncbi:MAG: FAD-dependent oxidoreductase, partial [Lentisphaerae bacterium]|nr:FAD-dependent oxidoreductase [Lentisphaerota bacterium]